MTRTTRQIVFATTALVSATLLAVVLTNQDLLLDLKPPPSDSGRMAQWLAAHPADWHTASALAATALDSSSPQRVTLWREAYAHAKRLAPLRITPNEDFVRAGLFHWSELGPRERALVLEAAAPLMRDPVFFETMHLSFWQLARDLNWLRRTAPDTTNARYALRRLAVSRGLFNDYRVLREDFRQATFRAFQAERHKTDPAALVNLLSLPVEKADEPLVRGILEELDRRPFEAAQLGPRIGHLVEYAVRHDVQPLAGILPLINSEPPQLDGVTRARAALDLGDATLATRIELASAIPSAAEWRPYYLDRARFEARRGNAAAAQAYLIRASAGGTTITILAAQEDVARILGKSTEEIHRQLVARAKEPLVWSGACGPIEVCTSAKTTAYVVAGHIDLALTMTQTDETPPYIEIFVDDARVAEGEVRQARSFRVPASAGLHDVEVRLVNAHTRNGIQRRVRLS